MLWTYLGMTLSNCDETVHALDCFERAEQLDPKRPLTKFQKVTVLMALNKLPESLEVLQELKSLCPKEAPIYVFMGKIYKRLGDKKQALKAFTMALELDQKDTNMVKGLIEKLHADHDMHDENEFQL